MYFALLRVLGVLSEKPGLKAVRTENTEPTEKRKNCIIVSSTQSDLLIHFLFSVKYAG